MQKNTFFYKKFSFPSVRAVLCIMFLCMVYGTNAYANTDPFGLYAANDKLNEAMVNLKQAYVFSVDERKAACDTDFVKLREAERAVFDAKEPIKVAEKDIYNAQNNPGTSPYSMDDLYFLLTDFVSWPLLNADKKLKEVSYFLHDRLVCQ